MLYMLAFYYETFHSFHSAAPAGLTVTAKEGGDVSFFLQDSIKWNLPRFSLCVSASSYLFFISGPFKRELDSKFNCQINKYIAFKKALN